MISGKRIISVIEKSDHTVDLFDLLSLKTMCDLATADIVIHINSYADFYAVLYTDTIIYSINSIVCGSHAHDILPYQGIIA